MKQRISEYLASLVAIRSISGREDICFDLIVTLATKPHVSLTSGEGWVLAHIVGKDPKLVSIFNGHVDTVLPNDAAIWDTDPYKLRTQGDKAFGLGATDMKAGLAVMLSLIDLYAETQPPHDLMFCFVAGEEVDGHGTKRFLHDIKTTLSGYTKIRALILEPTGLSYIGVGHRGNVFAHVTAHGVGGHGSKSYASTPTALAKMSAFVCDLPVVQARWSRSYAHPVLGTPTINVTALIAGNDSRNVVPNSATASLDIRFTPQLQACLDSELSGLCKTYGVNITYESVDLSPVGLCSDNDVIERAITTFGVDARVFPGATDLCFFSQHNIPAIVFGPGEPTKMHSPNEYVSIAKMVTCEKLLKIWIDEYV